MAKDWIYEVPVISLDKPMRVPRELVEQLRKARLPRKMISKMKKEAVDCPVLKKRVSFLECYNCKGFVRRIRGVVYCRGLD